MQIYEFIIALIISLSAYELITYHQFESVRPDGNKSDVESEKAKLD